MSILRRARWSDCSKSAGKNECDCGVGARGQKTTRAKYHEGKRGGDKGDEAGLRSQPGEPSSRELLRHSNRGEEQATDKISR